MKDFREMSKQESDDIACQVIKAAHQKYIELMGGSDGLGILVAVSQDYPETRQHLTIMSSNLALRSATGMLEELLKSYSNRLDELKRRTESN